MKNEFERIDFNPLKSLRKYPDGSLGLDSLVIFLVVFILIIVGVLLKIDMGPVVIIGFIIVLISSYIKSSWNTKKNSELLSRFAQVNEWTYGEYHESTQTKGSVFSIGHSEFVTDAISGTFYGLPFSTYVYQYSVGHGKGEREYDMQVFEITLPRALPHMIIDSLVESGNGGHSTLPIDFAPSQKIELEGDFSKYFSLYAPDHYGITALTLLAPDVMEVLMNFAASCDIEIIGNKVFFYWPNISGNQKDFINLFNCVGNVLKETLEKLTTSDIYAEKSQEVLHATASTKNIVLKRRAWFGKVKSFTAISYVSILLIGSLFIDYLPVGVVYTLFFLGPIILSIVFIIGAIYSEINRRLKQQALTRR